MKTPFYELAEKISNDMESNDYMMCVDIHQFGDLKHGEFLDDVFKPTDNEIKKYKVDSALWGCQINKDNHTGNNFRITALLFADLMWQDEMKGEKK